MIIASSRARTLRFLCLVLLLALFVAAAGLRIYLIYGNFRTLDMWDELGFSRTYLNWGYTVADGAAVAMVIGLYSRFMSLKQLALLGCFLPVRDVPARGRRARAAAGHRLGRAWW